MSEEPESRAQILTPFTVDIASGNVNYAAVVAGASHETADVKWGAASTDPRVSAGTSQSANFVGNLATVVNKALRKAQPALFYGSVQVRPMQLTPLGT
jgi:hypothetical protein